MVVLILRNKTYQLWRLEQSTEFIDGFLTAALIWNKDNEDRYFIVELDNKISVPVIPDYKWYHQYSQHVLFYGGFKTLNDLLEEETPVGQYGMVITTINERQKRYVCGLEFSNLDFLQGLLSAINTFNIPHVLRHMIYRDGTYYNILGRNLVMPTE